MVATKKDADDELSCVVTRAVCITINTQKGIQKFPQKEKCIILPCFNSKTSSIFVLPILHSHTDKKIPLCTFSTAGTRLLFAISS